MIETLLWWIMLMKVETISGLAAINMRKDSYLTITDMDLQSCVLKNPETILCHIRRPIHHMKDDHSLCETIPGTRTCKTKTTSCKNDWRELTSEIKYYYLCCDICNIKLLCENQVQAVRLSGAGLLRVGEGCLVKTEEFTVYSNKRLSSKISTTTKLISPEISPINHMINITMPEISYEFNLNNSDNLKQFEAIKRSLEIMKQSEPLSTDISYHDIHLYTATYLIVAVILVLVAIYCFQRWRKRQRKENRPTSTAEQSATSAATALAFPHTVAESVVIECSEIRENGQSSSKLVKSDPKRLAVSIADSGLRTPRGILTGNSVDLGNYHQCLGINHQLEDMHIEGKYCSILVPMNQTFHIPRPEDMQTTQFDPSSLNLDSKTITNIAQYHQIRSELLALSGNFDGFKDHTRSIPNNPLIDTVFRLGVCVPKPCTTQQAITSFFFNVSAVGFQYREDYCRLTGDKPWAPADYTAIAIFSVLGFVTLVSTSYDLCYRFLFKKDVKQMSTLCRSFSVYTNGQRLTTFGSGGGNLQCLDGIRTLAMVWVIIGHSFGTEPFIANPLDSNLWMFSAKSLWITAGTMTVDTFFTIAGVLLVYTTAGKMNHITFLKNLHWFYLNRYMRVTPLLAVTILLQTSYFNRITDGPYWVSVIDHTETCRKNWWTTLLHVQNIVNLEEMCASHSWYIAIDFQLYVVSPIVLVWVMTGKKYLGWMGVVGGLAAVLVASTVYCFNLNLPAGTIVPARFEDSWNYMRYYYFNTLARASPFFVGLLFGYILHLYRKNRIQIPWIIAIFFWFCSAGIIGGIFYFMYKTMQLEWDNDLLDNLMNSFMRPAYACAICWLIVACQHGYSGPINWLLSLDAWRLPARLSYGMFLFHYPLMFSLNGGMVAPIYFSVGKFTFKFLSYLVLALIYSFILTLLIDSPVTVLFKQLVDSVKRTKPVVKRNDETKADNINKNGKVINDDKNKKDIDASAENKIISNGESKPDDLIANVSNEVLQKSDSNDIVVVRNDSNDDDNIVVISDIGVNISSKGLPETK